MKKVISLLLMTVLVSLALSSCGGSAVGTYTLETIGGMTPFDWIKDSLDSSDEAVEDLLDIFGTNKEAVNSRFYVLTLESGGKATVYSEYAAMYEGYAESEGVWSLDGDVLTVTVNGEDLIMKFKNGVLTRDFNGAEGVFKKS